MIFRLLLQEGYHSVRLVGRSHDGGADLLARIAEKRWLFQAKKWNKAVGNSVVDETLAAVRTYRADVPVIVSLNGFESAVFQSQVVLMSEGIPLQLWDRRALIARANKLINRSLVETQPDRFAVRQYQEEAIEAIVRLFLEGYVRRGMVVMATGLGKTFVAAEAMRRINATSNVRILALAHTNDLVYQLERAFWPLLKPSQETVVWNGYERPTDESLQRAEVIFACIDSVSAAVSRGEELPPVDIILIDECHHAGASMYSAVINSTGAGNPGGPFLLGLTATPWRADLVDLEGVFGKPVISIDLVSGMRRGFLANVDYRMFTSNIDWDRLRKLRGDQFTPRAINRALFIEEWDDSVVYALKEAWDEQPQPRAIVFCGTIDHAIQMRDKINALGFCQAAAVFSAGSNGHSMKPYERNRILADFDSGKIGVICAVDIFNEGIDVPDVNILVFQRVTHSRRIFVQQLGRGLRLAPGKTRVTVLDFVSDIRRFAAGLDLKDQIEKAEAPSAGRPGHVRLNNTVRFMRVGGGDPVAETFLRIWIDDVGAVEAAGEDASVLKYPPELPRSLG
jgi:superfamily II DNA or RNA helicase